MMTPSESTQSPHLPARPSPAWRAPGPAKASVSATEWLVDAACANLSRWVRAGAALLIIATGVLCWQLLRSQQISAVALAVAVLVGVTGAALLWVSNWLLRFRGLR